jgi:hypothetical protein
MAIIQVIESDCTAGRQPASNRGEENGAGS